MRSKRYRFFIGGAVVVAAALFGHARAQAEPSSWEGAVEVLDDASTAAADVDLTDGVAETCTDVRALLSSFGSWGSRPLAIRLPGFDLGVQVESAKVTADCGAQNYLDVEGTVQLPRTGATDLPVAVHLRVDWGSDTDTVPDVTFELSVGGGLAGDIVELSDLTPIASALVPGFALDPTEDLPTDLRLQGFDLAFQWTETDGSWLDVVASTQIRQDPDNVSDTVNVRVLLSMTSDPLGGAPTVLTGLHADPLLGDTFTLGMAFRGSIGDYLGSIELPEMHMAQVQPASRTVSLAQMPVARSLPRQFFEDAGSTLPVEYEYDGEITVAADVALDSLGDAVQGTFGYADEAVASLLGKADITFGDLAGAADRVPVTSASLDVALPALDGSQATALPDWLRVGATTFELLWEPEADAFVLGFETSADIDVPDRTQPGGAVTLSPTLAGEIQVLGEAGGDVITIGMRGEVPGTAAAPAWPEPFGTSWLDLHSLGADVVVIAPLGDDPAMTLDVDAEVTGRFSLGDKEFSVGVGFELRDGGTEFVLNAKFLETLGMQEVLGLWGVDLPSDFDVVIGTPELDGTPVSITARLFLPPSGDPQGSIAVNAPGTIQIGSGSFDVNLLVALETLPGGEYQVMAGARLASTTVTDLVSIVDAGLATSVDSTPFGGVALPDTALLFNLADVDEPSHALSEEERAFFDPLYGCTADPCDYEVELTAGVHLLAALTMPEETVEYALEGGGTETRTQPVFNDIFKAFWLDGAPPVLLDLSVGLPTGDSLSFSGLAFDMRFPVRPGPEVRPDWFRSANLGIGLRVGTGSVTFEVSGDLGIRMRDESLTDESACTTAQKHWLPTGATAESGTPTDACYDLLDFRVAAGVSLGAVPAFTLEGSIQSEGGWRSPFGLDFVEFGGVALQLRIEVPPSGNVSVLIGFYVSGKLILDPNGFEKDIAGSFVVGLRVLQSPPFVIPEFRGIRVASQAGIELADVARLYEIAQKRAAQVVAALPPDQVSPELAQLAALPPLDFQAVGFNVGLRNLELMIGLGDFPAVCISPGVRLGAELYLGAEPVDGSTIDPETPGDCPTEPIADPIGCLTAADPCSAAVALDVGLDGLMLAGSMGPFGLGPISWDEAVFEFELRPASQRLRVRGGASIDPLASGTVDVTIAPDGFAYLGDVQLFPGSTGAGGVPAFRAKIEGETRLDVGAFFSGGGQGAVDFDVHAVLQADFDELMRQLTEPLLTSFRDGVVAASVLYDGLKATDGDVVQTLTDLPDDMRALGATVPLWYDDPDADAVDALAAIETIDGLFQTAGLEPPTFGQIFSGVELAEPFSLPGFWAFDECWAAPFVPGLVVDGECYAVYIDRIPGISHYVPGAPATFTEFLEGTVEPRLTTALRLVGLPDDVDFVDLTDQLVAQLRSVSAPVALPCVDFRLLSTDAAPNLTLRVAAQVFGLDLGLDVDWDFGEPAGPQALVLGQALLEQLFVEPATPTCEPIGTTTVGGTLGEGDGLLVDTSFAPSLAPEQVVEGGITTLSGVYGAGLGDSTVAEIQWGDGTTQTTTVGALRAGVTRTYLDDDPTATAADTVAVRVTIGDQTETVLGTVLNVAPSDLSLTLAVDDGTATSVPRMQAGVPYVLEGQTLVVTGELRDPGHRDTFTATVRWGDGTSTPVTDVQLVDPANDLWRFTTARPFADDDPSGTSFDASTLTVVVSDDDGGRTATRARFGVQDVAPSQITVTPQVGGADEPAQIDEGVPVTYRVEWFDPGVPDSFAVIVDWGDGTTTPAFVNDRFVELAHTYGDDDPTATASDAYTITARVIDDDTLAGTAQQELTVHNVDPAVTVTSDVLDAAGGISVQYSDPIGGDPSTATVDPDVLTVSAHDVTPDELTMTATFDGGDLPAWLRVEFDEADDCAPVTGDEGHRVCTWTLSQQVDPVSGIHTDIAPGTYDLLLRVDDDDTGSWSTTIPIEVLPEDARLWYVGPTFAATTSARTGTATLELRATVRDITSAVPSTDPAWDPWAGDIRQSTVRFEDRESGSALCAAPAVDEVVTPFDVFDPASNLGIGSCDWTADIGNAEAQAFTIATIVGGYYDRDETDDDTVVTVARPLDDFITGGGYLELTDSAGVFAGADGSKSNFGFHVKFNKKGTNLQGGVTIIVRAADGRVYRIKTNAMDSLGIDGGAAQFESKANVADVTDEGAEVSVGGNFVLQMLMTDGTDEDLIGFTLWDERNVGGGQTTRELLFSSRWDGNQTLQQALAGGEVRVH